MVFIEKVTSTLTQGESKGVIAEFIPQKNGTVTGYVLKQADGTLSLSSTRMPKSHPVHLMTFVEGRELVDVNPQTNEIVEAFGHALGSFDSALQNVCDTLPDIVLTTPWGIQNSLPFVREQLESLYPLTDMNDFALEPHVASRALPDHPRMEDDLEWRTPIINKADGDIRGPTKGVIAHEVLKYVLSQMDDNWPSTVRTSVIHMDANDRNVLVPYWETPAELPQLISSAVSKKKIKVKLIDLGECSKAPLVGDLSIALAYLMFDKSDWLDTACLFVRSYTEKCKLTAEEARLIFPLAMLRLLLSMCMAKINIKNYPANSNYYLVSQLPLWRFLASVWALPSFAYPQFAIAHAACPSSFPLPHIANPPSSSASLFAFDARLNLTGLERNLMGPFASNSDEAPTIPGFPIAPSASVCPFCSESCVATVSPYLAALPPLLAASPRPIQSNSVLRDGRLWRSVRPVSLAVSVFPQSVLNANNMSIIHKNQAITYPQADLFAPRELKFLFAFSRSSTGVLSAVSHSDRSCEPVLAVFELTDLSTAAYGSVGKFTPLLLISGVAANSLPATGCILSTKTKIGSTSPSAFHPGLLREAPLNDGFEQPALIPHLDVQVRFVPACTVDSTCPSKLNIDSIPRCIGAIGKEMEAFECALSPNPSALVASLLTCVAINERPLSSGSVMEHADPHSVLNNYSTCSCMMDGNATEYANTSRETVANIRAANTPNACTVAYRSRNPLSTPIGFGCYMYDDRGMSYLDAVNNVANIGHANPYVARAVAVQAGILNTNSRYLFSQLPSLAAEIKKTLPAKFNRVYLVCTGTEANELAIRLAKSYTRRRKLICMDGAYHGNSNMIINVSPYKHHAEGGLGTPSFVLRLPLPDTLNGPYRAPTECPETANKMGSQFVNAMSNYGDDAADLVREFSSLNALHLPTDIQTDSVTGSGSAIEDPKTENEGICAFIHETMICCGGVHYLHPEYRARVYKEVRAQGGVVIADEVQSGVARIGNRFWCCGPEGSSRDLTADWAEQFQKLGVSGDATPDIITMGKPLGNGVCIAAVACTQEIADAFGKLEYFNTFGGSPIPCVAGLSALKCVREWRLLERSENVGKLLFDAVVNLAEVRRKAGKGPYLSHVRGGEGLMLGIEIVKNEIAVVNDKNETSQVYIPGSEEARLINERLRDLGVLSTRDGMFDNTLKIKPPLLWTKKEVDSFTTALNVALDDTRVQNEFQFKPWGGKCGPRVNPIWDPCTPLCGQKPITHQGGYKEHLSLMSKHLTQPAFCGVTQANMNTDVHNYVKDQLAVLVREG